MNKTTLIARSPFSPRLFHRFRNGLLLCGLILPAALSGQTPAAAPVAANSAASAIPAGPTIPKLKDVNPDLLRLVVADQWDRGNDMFGKGQVKPDQDIDWNAVSAHDAARRQAVRQLLAKGVLTSGRDYEYASLIFQHSERPEGYLLAHVLAVTAVEKGDKNARWMAAATLDRYLQSMGKPQVFGTQFPPQANGWTMEPYDSGLLSDAERALWCVIPLSQQRKQLAKHNFSTGIVNCP